MSEEKGKKRKWYTQSFKEEWLKDPELKDWVAQDKSDKESSYCKCCKTTFKNANKHMLLKHKESVKHKNAFKASKSSNDISLLLAKQANPETSKTRTQIAKSELFIAAFFVEHNVPAACMDHFMPLLQRVCPDSNIAEQLSMKRTKLSYIIEDGIASHEKDLISEVCRTQKFSVIIDESTDISVTQILAIVVRYFDVKKEDVTDALFDTVTVEDGTALGLYTALKSVMAERNVPMHNIIGFGSDNCSSMMGTKNGFQKLLKDDVPSVFIMGCVCHSFALCASHAVSVLPSYLEAFLKDITSYFSRSSKRQRDFTLIQEVVESVMHKIPKLSQTRWLSRENVITVILEQYDALVLYFQSEAQVDKVDGARRIHDTLINRGTKHMLLFLQYILRKVNKLNTEFQSEHFRLHLLYQMVSSEYKTILGFFIKPEVLESKKLSEIDPRDETNYQDLDQIYLGGAATAHLIQVPFPDSQTEKRFKSDCLKFMVELCAQITKRFPFDENNIIAQMKVLDPQASPDDSPKSIIPLAVKFPSVVSTDTLNDLDDEWRSYRSAAPTLAIPHESIPQYWYKLQHVKDGLGNEKFGMLSKFMLDLIVLPHSSACVERIFSLMNCVKTKSSNSMKTETMTSRLLAKQNVTKNNTTCMSWHPSEQLVKEVEGGEVSRKYKKRCALQKELKVPNVDAEIEQEEDVMDLTL